MGKGGRKVLRESRAVGAGIECQAREILILEGLREVKGGGTTLQIPGLLSSWMLGSSSVREV